MLNFNWIKESLFDNDPKAGNCFNSMNHSRFARIRGGMIKNDGYRTVFYDGFLIVLNI